MFCLCSIINWVIEVPIYSILFEFFFFHTMPSWLCAALLVHQSAPYFIVKKLKTLWVA